MNNRALNNDSLHDTPINALVKQAYLAMHYCKVTTAQSLSQELNRSCCSRRRASAVYVSAPFPPRRATYPHKRRLRQCMRFCRLRCFRRHHLRRRKRRHYRRIFTHLNSGSSAAARVATPKTAHHSNRNIETLFTGYT